MNVAGLEAYINRFFGYGCWTAPIWFVGMEEGGCDTLEEFERRLTIWIQRGCQELEDGPSYHQALGLTRHFGRGAKLQATWEKLLRIYLARHDLPCDTEAVRSFQAERYGKTDCGFASLELFPLPSTSTAIWFYRSVRAVPYLINREVYKYYVYPRRAEELKRRIAIHTPQTVVIYGVNYRHEWEGIIGTELDESALPDALEASFGRTKILVIPHPVSYNRAQTYWKQVGDFIRSTMPSAAAATGL
jgi:hypothetical protein